VAIPDGNRLKAAKPPRMAQETLIDIVPRLLAEIANDPAYRTGGSAADTATGLPDDQRMAALRANAGRLVMFFGVSFEQVRHAAALARYTDLEPFLVYLKGDGIAGHYARAFRFGLAVDDNAALFRFIAEVRPLALTITLPSEPLHYRALLPLFSQVYGIRTIPFVYDLCPPENILSSAWFRAERYIVENCDGFYSWHEPVPGVSGGLWTPMATMFNAPIGLKRPRSIAYAGSLSPGMPEHNFLRFVETYNDAGYSVDIFDAKGDCGYEPRSPMTRVHPRVPEFELIDRLAPIQFGFAAPYLAERPGDKTFHPGPGTEIDWCNRHGVPGKIVLYLEAGVIPIVHRETAYVAEFLERHNIGYVFDDDGYHDLERALARKDPGEMLANISELRETALSWKQPAGLLAEFFRNANERPRFPRRGW